MRKAYILLLTIPFLSLAQFNPSAPWSVDNEQNKKGELTFNEQVQIFNAYWIGKDKDAKGSGYKPFKRWEQFWKSNVNSNGFVIGPSEIKNALAHKKQSKLNKGIQVAPPSNWQPVGPFSHTNTGSWASGQGRVNIVCVDPSNENTVYLGAPAGGIWKSTDAGVNWTPLTDFIQQIGVSGIAVDHSNSNVIYISTGDKDAGDSYSIGVLKSTDGGVTWNPTGLSFNNTTSKSGDIIMHPSNNQILFCATNEGIFKTTDAGATWNNVQAGNFAQGSIKFKPYLPSNVYAVSNNRFYKSTDTGSTFSSVATGLPVNSTRLVMDVTPANINYIYILAYSSSKNTLNGLHGVYRSIDSGVAFTLRSDNTTDLLETRQGFYDLALAASRTSAEEIYIGCLNVWKSTTGGTAFTKINNWNQPNSPSYTHADIHFLGFFGNKLYCGSDGGIYVSSNGGTNFSDLTSGAQISQFYRIAVSTQSAANMVGGLQDNGGHSYSGGLWKNYFGGDGMDTGIDPTDQNLHYGFNQYGAVLNISDNGGNNLSGQVGAPAAETNAATDDDGGNWITPMKINSSGEVFSGFERLYRLSGNSWIQQSTGVIGGGDVENIEIHPSDDNLIYVSNGFQLYKSINKGVDFTLVYTASAVISSIEAHATDLNTVYLTTEGTNFGKVLKSTDGGSNFSDITNGIPDISKNVIVHQGQHANNPLYVGTYLGVYYLDDTMNSWELFDTNLPNVSVTDLEINLADHKLIAATYGRGIWQTDIPQNQLSESDFSLSQIGIYPNPSAGIFNVDFDNMVALSIEVFDVTGKAIYKVDNLELTNSFQIDLKGYSNGLYFVKLQSDKGIVTKKIVKK